MHAADRAFIKTYLITMCPAAALGIAVMAAFWLPGELTWTRLIVGGGASIVVTAGVAALIARRLARNS